ncbi:MAG: L-2,4-diaminobutyrate decarboxylase [Planctomycetaceae bacterium]|nr:L-2,4-diaminobutyrate decarboxylase [Planctomycetaceae bacterium]
MQSIDIIANAAARERIQATYSPELFQDAARQWAEILGQHLESVLARKTPVLNWNEPVSNCEFARSFLDDSSSEDRANSNTRHPQILDRFQELLRVMLARGHNLHHPHYVGHQVPPPVPLAGLFDALGSVTNQVMAIYEMGPWGMAVEQALVGRLSEAIGWDPKLSAGIVTHGGAAANLTALLAARNVTLGDTWEAGFNRGSPQPVLVTQADAHYSMMRAAGIMGLGTRQVIKAELDSLRRMDPVKLDLTLTRLQDAGHPIIAVVACACATPIGAFDPLPEIADACQKHGVWIHVDAAHGGSALLSGRYRHLLRGLERADSVVWDAHKMLFVPALCAFVFYRQKQHSFRAFQQEAQYLFDPSAPDLREFDGGVRTLECTKRTAAYGLWGLWSLFGPSLFADLVDVCFDLGATLHAKLTAAPDFEPLHEPQCNIVVFRYIPAELRGASDEVISEFQLRLRRMVIQSGEFYLVHCVINGVAAFRTTLMNPLTTSDDLDQLLDTLRKCGSTLLAEAMNDQ